VHGPMAWNSLPDDLRAQQDYESFRQGLKTWLFSRYYRVQRTGDLLIALFKSTFTIHYHTIWNWFRVQSWGQWCTGRGAHVRRGGGMSYTGCVSATDRRENKGRTSESADAPRGNQVSPTRTAWQPTDSPIRTPDQVIDLPQRCAVSERNIPGDSEYRPNIYCHDITLFGLTAVIDRTTHA